MKNGKVRVVDRRSRQTVAGPWPSDRPGWVNWAYGVARELNAREADHRFDVVTS